MTPPEVPEAIHQILQGLRLTLEKEAQAREEHLREAREMERQLSSEKARAETYAIEWKKALEKVESLQGQLAVAKDRLHTLMKELHQERHAREELVQSLTRAEKVILSVQEQLDQSRRTAQTLQAHKEALEFSLEKLQQQLLLRETQIQKLYDSYSWKVTGPLRWAYAIVLKILHAIERCIRDTLSNLFFKTYRILMAFRSFVQRHRRLDSVIQYIYQRFPDFATWMQRLSSHPPLWTQGAKESEPDASSPRSPRTRFLEEQLKMAILQCHGT